MYNWLYFLTSDKLKRKTLEPSCKEVFFWAFGVTNMCDKISQFFNVLFIHVFIQVSCLRGKYLNNLFFGYISKIVYFVICVTVRFAWILSHSILYNFIQLILFKKFQKNSFQNVKFPNRQKKLSSMSHLSQWCHKISSANQWLYRKKIYTKLYCPPFLYKKIGFHYPSVFLHHIHFIIYFGLFLPVVIQLKHVFSFIFQHKRVRGKKLSETRLGLLAKWLESSLYWGKFRSLPLQKLRQLDQVTQTLQNRQKIVDFVKEQRK